MTEPRMSPSGPLVPVAGSTDDVTNVSNVTGETSSDALDTLFARTLRYLDLEDNPVGLWNFDNTIAAVRGPGFTLSAGTYGFTAISPGVSALVMPVSGRLVAPLDAALQIAGDLSIEMLIQYQDFPSNSILVNHGAGGVDTDPTNNTLYQVQFPVTGPIRNYRFDWESGAGVDQSFSTPTAALSPSLPTVHTVIDVGWRRQNNVLTPFLNGRPFSSASGVLTAPTGGTNGQLFLGGTAALTNASIFVMMSLAIYDYARPNAQWKDSYNRSMGERFGIIP